MPARDVRKEPPQVILELRKRAIALRLKGATHREVSQTLEVSEVVSRKWWRLYKESGMEGLELGSRGRPPGACKVLTPRQEGTIIKAITDKTPDQLKLPFALWTRPAIRQFIEHRFGIRLPLRTLGEYLKRWNFTPQRPKRLAYEQQPAEVRKWLEEVYPDIVKQAKKAGAEILWGDETGISNQDQVGRGYSPKGRTPVVRGMARRVTTSMISAIGNKGAVRFMIYKGGLRVPVFLKFLKRLCQGGGRRIFLIVDNLRVHKAKAVIRWLEEQKDAIRLFYLPPYSPELNPDEYLNNTIKARLRNQPVPASHEELTSQLRSVMQSSQRRPEMIRNLFRHPSVNYAA